MVTRSITRLFKRSVVVDLPVILSRDTLNILIEEVITHLPSTPKKIVFNFQKLQQLQVGAITVLSNLIEFSKLFGVPVEYQNVRGCEAYEFLEGAGFCSIYLDREQATKKCSKEFLTLKLVEYQRSLSYISDTLIPWMARVLAVDPRALTSLRVVFEEIFNNIKDHSTVDVGCSCGHFDETNGMITISISDFGVGIPHNVNKNHNPQSDHAAIELACQQGFTTKSTPRNMGAGLHVLVRNVVGRNRGNVIIQSGRGVYTCTPSVRKGEWKGSGRAAPEGTIYPGTLIYVKLEVKKFVPSEFEEEFVWE